jgi:hypothetical protein
MSGRPTFALGALILLASPAAAAPERQPVSVTNASARIAACALVVDGHTRTYLKLHPGKSWSAPFDPRQDIRLVCEHARALNWRLKPGAAYRVVDAGGKADLAEGGGE